MAQIVSVILSSHTPGFMVPPERWDVIHAGRMKHRTFPLPEDLRRNLDAETLEVTKKHHALCIKALARLRDFFTAARPDLVVMFGDDQNENFHTRIMPPFCVYTGKSTFGYPWKLLKTVFGEEPGPRIEVPCASDVATNLVKVAAERGFDLSWSQEFPDTEWGLPHSMIRLVEKLDIKVPLIPIHINAFEEPTATPQRCFQLGQMMKDAFDEVVPSGTRIAIVGSGGLSHEAAGDNAGWIDADHDQWVLRQVRQGNYESLASLTNQDLIRGQDQELRNWLAALPFVDGTEPAYLEYVLSYRSLVGNAFAAWTFPKTGKAT
jgi:Catalytic LigB subunit of aromatic ring-opening dioxygenase